MRVGQALLDLVRASGARSLFVVGVGKNVGKTVTMRAVYEAAAGAGLCAGLASIGRDGESADAHDHPKPRLRLQPRAVLATARSLLPRSPASEILALSNLQTAAGPLIFARVVSAAFYELAGPPTASGVRAVVDELLARGDIAIVDGAIDRIAPLAGGSDAIVVACGAGAAATMQQAVDDVRALVERLDVARFDPQAPALHLDGALTAPQAAAFIAAGERRQIVVRDPTQIVLSGRPASHAFAQLRIRCRRPLHVVAATVASIGSERSFEPRTFARAVAAATRLPTFDVYAGEQAA